ncbi:Pseudouridine synthase I, TruA, alpha/beta domain protein [Kalmanozyma brasiliensis GHG001]|uniref:Pseudouridine synthase I TruA alpha/beta domain-containing protein n=1 Tax=Kalmanozyma brasiliensis (strain GHG001) TaxID=1365824 RepID=V5EA32_KALBG|nr:Pseudouridine synthase I, TruA, alpha/beta domain protein [Kalmanozyma brasiliensis GHG001]EST07226.1 Pseudouridine synthase I, TruA, alpha/beta domain protein [Kalmanozyma brasiliensis GHG001]
MTERLEQEVVAAAAGTDEIRSQKRQLDPESTTTGAAPVTNEDVVTDEAGAKRARFDDSVTRNKDGKKKWERRDRRGTGRSEENTASDPSSSSSSADRLPKRKVAVKFGYCGIGYSGLQINPGVKTIEGDIFEAFCTAGAVSADNAVNPNKVGLQRAARTDRGVHAAGNLLSLKLILQPEGLKEGETLVDKVNSLLPEFIRIWGITRVQNGFNARQSCDSRMYEYLLPTYVFIPPKPGSTMHDMLLRMRTEELAKEGSDGKSKLDDIVEHPFWAEQGTSHDFSTDIAAKKKYRLPPAALQRIRSIFAHYSGSHNFHNFTVGKEFRDRSCHRFMKQLTISDPKMIQDAEWVSIKFHGQSFMLHQIRKMIGLLVLVGRTGAGEGLVDECFGPARVHIPKAPGLGLLLERPIFDAYNTRIRNNNDKISRLMRKKSQSKSEAETEAPPTESKSDQSEAGKASSLQDELREFISYNSHTSAMETFKQQWIYDRIIATEHETNEFGKWLNYLDVFQGPDFEFLNPKGVIPPEAIVKVGEFHRDQLRRKKEAQDKDAAGENGAEDEEEEDSEAYGMKGAQLDEYEG